MEKSKVYFIKKISSENIVLLYKRLGINLSGNVAIKVHSGEAGNQNYLKPEFMKDIVDCLNGTIVECNTAYAGMRNETEKHLKLLKNHGWSDLFKVDLLDASGPDMVLKIPNGKVLKENYVGKNLKNYKSLLIISHFKGHPAGGYGGAIKQLSIGCASTKGKCLIHSGGRTADLEKVWQVVNLSDVENDQLLFLNSMADAASSVMDYFKDRVAYINIMANLSVDCDCCKVAEDPCMDDIGILASLDPVALDKACLDLIYSSNDKGKDHFIERVESRNGAYVIDALEKLGYGNKLYDLIEID